MDEQKKHEELKKWRREYQRMWRERTIYSKDKEKHHRYWEKKSLLEAMKLEGISK